MAFENIPHEMRQFKSWCMWRYEMNADGKMTKRPYSCITGYPVSPNDLSKATTYENVIAAMQSRPEFWSGIGFMVSQNDPYVFIDLGEPKNPDGSPGSPEIYNARVANQTGTEGQARQGGDAAMQGLHARVADQAGTERQARQRPAFLQAQL